MKRIVLFILFLAISLKAYDFRAYDIGGAEKTSTSKIILKGKEFTLIPFSDLNLNPSDINLDGDFTLIFPIINGNKLQPIQLASNYKNQIVKIKIFNGTKLVSESEDLYLDDDYVTFNLEINED